MGYICGPYTILRSINALNNNNNNNKTPGPNLRKIYVGTFSPSLTFSSLPFRSPPP